MMCLNQTTLPPSSGKAIDNLCNNNIESTASEACGEWPLQTTLDVIDKETSQIDPCCQKIESIQHFPIEKCYHDYSRDGNPDFDDDGRSLKQEMGLVLQSKKRGHRPGAANLFPAKLHLMLSSAKADGFDHIVSWQPHGRCFKVHQPTRFVDEIMPNWFQQTKLASFQRQLSLYGFSRLSTGPDRGGYYHEMYLQGHYKLCCRIVRIRIKGTGNKMKDPHATEPSFYTMTPCMESPAACQLLKSIVHPHYLGDFACSSSMRNPVVQTSSNISLSSEEDPIEWKRPSASTSQVVVEQATSSQGVGCEAALLVEHNNSPFTEPSSGLDVAAPLKASSSCISLNSKEEWSDYQSPMIRRSSAASVYESFQEMQHYFSVIAGDDSEDRMAQRSPFIQQSSVAMVRDSFIDPSICMSLATDDDMTEWNGPDFRRSSDACVDDCFFNSTPSVPMNTDYDIMRNPADTITDMMSSLDVEEPIMLTNLSMPWSTQGLFDPDSLVDRSMNIEASRCSSPWLQCCEDTAAATDEEITYGGCQFHYLDPESLFGW